MSEITFHIGFHKTASTWLQQEVFSKIASAEYFGHEFIYENIIASRGYDFSERPAQEVIRRAAEEDRLIFSTERLSGNPHSGGYDSYYLSERLYKIAPKAKVIIVVRDQVSMIVSSYKQYVKSGGSCTLEEYLQPPQDGRIPLFDLEHLKYDKIVKRYLSLFGNENVLVLPFERLRADTYGFVSTVMQFIGVEEFDYSAAGSSGKLNVALNDFQIGVLRAANALGTTSSLTPHKTIFYRFGRFLARLIKKIGKNQLTDKVDFRYSTVVNDILGRYYFESNKELSTMIDIAPFEGAYTGKS